jgi:acyl-CoA thioester hydrolase
MKFTTSLRVRYAETDQMSVAYHGNYFAWFEVGRVELLRSLGLTYAGLEEQDCILPVVEARCQYRKPARYDDLLEIVSWVQAMRGPIVLFAYGLYKDGELLAEAETKHVVLNKQMKRRKLPDAYRQAMLQAMEPESKAESKAQSAPVLQS